MPQDFSESRMPPSAGPPGFSQGPRGMAPFGDILKCENCGAEFAAGSGVSEGDDCPKCSGGSSTTISGIRMGRGVVKGVICLVALAAGGIGWIVKKSTGAA